MAKALFAKERITIFELFVWLVFFLLLLSTYVFTLPLLENFLLVLGLIIGIFCIFKVFMLGKDMKNYRYNKKEIAAWLYRFCVFKIVPIFLPLLAKGIAKLLTQK